MSEQDERFDLVWGISGIAELIGRNTQQTYHMLRSGHLPPAKQIGGRWVVSRKELERLFTGEVA